MRRIYESDALKRDDEAFTPREHDGDTAVRSFRSIDATAWSDRLLPHPLRCRAVSIRVETPREQFEVGQPVPFRVSLHNSLPIPVTVRTSSPVLWTWSVDGLEEGSHVPVNDPPAEANKLRLDRGETLRFDREWSGLFRVSSREWEPPAPGEYTLEVWINAEGDRAGLTDDTTVELV